MTAEAHRGCEPIPPVALEAKGIVVFPRAKWQHEIPEYVTAVERVTEAYTSREDDTSLGDRPYGWGSPNC